MKYMKQLIMIMALSFVASTAVACGLSEKVDGYENTDVHHAWQHWKAGDKSPVPFMLLDVRTAEEYAEGHIRGALLIPVQELEQRISEVPKDRQVYVYCRSGVRSSRASNILVNEYSGQCRLYKNRKCAGRFYGLERCRIPGGGWTLTGIAIPYSRHNIARFVTYIMM
jgi:hydroxyacylglutathione hydrolase